MAQQLNLYAPRFAPRPPRWSARQGLVATACCLGAGALGTIALQSAALDALRQAQQLESHNGPLRQRLVDKARQQPAMPAQNLDLELANLKALEAGQRRIRAALDAGVAGVREGHAEYLVSLARQASAQVWITGFSVSEGGELLVIDGRMTDASALTDYLRSLNAEPRFRGRPFAQFTLQAVASNDGQPLYTEFSLRATAPAPSATAALAALPASQVFDGARLPAPPMGPVPSKP